MAHADLFLSGGDIRGARALHGNKPGQPLFRIELVGGIAIGGDVAGATELRDALNTVIDQAAQLGTVEDPS